MKILVNKSVIAPFFCACFFINLLAKAQVQVEPPFWWKDMVQDTLSLLITANNFNSNTNCTCKNVPFLKTKVWNSKYASVTTSLKNFREDSLYITCSNGINITVPILQKEPHNPNGFNSSDVVYLIMPDRFANGNTANDKVPGFENTNRSKIDGRHGGDLQGIIDNIDYIKNLGVTALWLTPFQEMNQKEGSYHGYGMSNLYQTDPRFGAGVPNSNLNNLKYKQFVAACHQKGLKVIMDVVPNHIGADHPWWSQQPRLTQFVHDSTMCNFIMPATTDINASKKDKISFEKGWFVPSMPDLNQDNSYLNNYLIQNHIWWMQEMKIDALRLDTQPFNERNFITKWNNAIIQQYPNTTIVGEAWGMQPWLPKYYQGNKTNKDGYNSGLSSVMDFPVFNSLIEALKTNDATKFYEVIAQDFMYEDANKNFVFFGNHDTERFFTSIKEDEKKLRMGITLWATLRGIPQLYYGDELAMTGVKGINDGLMRADMPGGWPGAYENIFTGNGFNEKDIAWRTLQFTQKILQWRSKSTPIFNGKTMHFAPKNNVYVMIRYEQNKAIAIVSNFGKQAQAINLNNYLEELGSFKNRRIVFGGKNTEEVDGETSLVVELW